MCIMDDLYRYFIVRRKSSYKLSCALLSIGRWWKDLEVPTKLSYARDRMVEGYFWIMGVYFEPKYGLARNISTKLLAIASIFDDTFDAYATFQELQLLVEAMERFGYIIKTLDFLFSY